MSISCTVSTCSNVFKSSNNTSFRLQNYMRVAEVWLDEYRDNYYADKPQLRGQPLYGDISDQLRFRREKCPKSFKWFMEEIAFDTLQQFPPPVPNRIWGEVYMIIYLFSLTHLYINTFHAAVMSRRQVKNVTKCPKTSTFWNLVTIVDHHEKYIQISTNMTSIDLDICVILRILSNKTIMVWMVKPMTACKVWISRCVSLLNTGSMQRMWLNVHVYIICHIATKYKLVCRYRGMVQTLNSF